MSVQDLSQFVALLALDRHRRAHFLDEATRQEAIDSSGFEFDEDLELPLVQKAAMDEIFEYLRVNDRPIPDVDPDG